MHFSQVPTSRAATSSGFFRTLLAAVAALALAALTVLHADPAGAAPVVPAVPTALPVAAEALADYVPATSCDATAKAGTVALGTLLTRTYPGTTFGGGRDCGADALSTSEHYDGRAVDWMTTVRTTTGKARGDAVVSWLLATDTNKVAYANARRLGVMYIIWNNKIWGSYRPADGWREYSGCSAKEKSGTAYDTACHRDHVHLSLSWAGAMKRTSFWSGKVAAAEFGPCRTADLNWAAPTSKANYTRCPALPGVQPAVDASTLGKTLVGYSGMYLFPGSRGPAVKAVQQAIGAGADGAFGPGTRAALVTWQQRVKVPATGVVDAATWRALIAPHLPKTSGAGTGGGAGATAPPPVPLVPAKVTVRAGLDADGRPDLLARRSDGTLWLYPTTTTGVAPGRKIGAGWHIFTTVLSPGDFTGDGLSDVVAKRTDGRLYLYAGNGRGGFAGAGKVIGNGWSIFDTVLSPGDFTGDGKADLIARRTDGRLYLYAGNGKGGFAGAGKVIGSGWQVYNTVLSPGDFTGDGKADVLARRPDGRLYLYAGNGKGGFASAGRVISSAWKPATAILAAGDVTGDRRPDLFGRTSTGSLYVYAGNGRGGYSTGRKVGAGWGTLLLVGVR